MEIDNDDGPLGKLEAINVNFPIGLVKKMRFDIDNFNEHFDEENYIIEALREFIYRRIRFDH